MSFDDETMRVEDEKWVEELFFRLKPKLKWNSVEAVLTHFQDMTDEPTSFQMKEMVTELHRLCGGGKPTSELLFAILTLGTKAFDALLGSTDHAFHRQRVKRLHSETGEEIDLPFACHMFLCNNNGTKPEDVVTILKQRTEYCSFVDRTVVDEMLRHAKRDPYDLCCLAWLIACLPAGQFSLAEYRVAVSNTFGDTLQRRREEKEEEKLIHNRSMKVGAFVKKLEEIVMRYDAWNETAIATLALYNATAAFEYLKDQQDFDAAEQIKKHWIPETESIVVDSATVNVLKENSFDSLEHVAWFSRANNRQLEGYAKLRDDVLSRWCARATTITTAFRRLAFGTLARREPRIERKILVRLCRFEEDLKILFEFAEPFQLFSYAGDDDDDYPFCFRILTDPSNLIMNVGRYVTEATVASRELLIQTNCRFPGGLILAAVTQYDQQLSVMSLLNSVVFFQHAPPEYAQSYLDDVLNMASSHIVLMQGTKVRDKLRNLGDSIKKTVLRFADAVFELLKARFPITERGRGTTKDIVHLVLQYEDTIRRDCFTARHLRLPPFDPDSGFR